MANESYASEKELSESLFPEEAAVAVFFESCILKFGAEFKLGLSSEEERGRALLQRAKDMYEGEGKIVKVVKALNGRMRGLPKKK